MSALRLKTIFYFFALMSADSMSAVKLHSVERRSSHMDCMGGPTESICELQQNSTSHILKISYVDGCQKMPRKRNTPLSNE